MRVYLLLGSTKANFPVFEAVFLKAGTAWQWRAPNLSCKVALYFHVPGIQSNTLLVRKEAAFMGLHDRHCVDGQHSELGGGVVQTRRGQTGPKIRNAKVSLGLVTMHSSKLKKKSDGSADVSWTSTPETLDLVLAWCCQGPKKLVHFDNITVCLVQKKSAQFIARTWTVWIHVLCNAMIYLTAASGSLEDTDLVYLTLVSEAVPMASAKVLLMSTIFVLRQGWHWLFLRANVITFLTKTVLLFPQIFLGNSSENQIGSHPVLSATSVANSDKKGFNLRFLRCSTFRLNSPALDRPLQCMELEFFLLCNRNVFNVN